MESTITPKNVGTLCRICLTSSKNLIDLTSPLNEKTLNFKEQWSIHKMLEIVTFSKVVLHQKFPSKICQMCRSLLKIAYELQMQFNNSQKLLKNVTNNASTEKLNSLEEVLKQDSTESSAPATVELIFGDIKFDLNDILVIEDDKQEKSSFDGFLRNLGSEISARFVNGNSKVTQKRHTKNYLSVEKLNKHKDRSNENVCPSLKKPGRVVNKHSMKSRQKCNYDNVDISRLKVRKYPEECKIVIEENDNDDDERRQLTKIIKTLYECPLCKKVLPSQSDLETHKEIKHLCRNFLVCEKCGHLAQTRSQLYHHMQKHKGNRFKCNQCDKGYNTVSRLKVHLETHKNERRYLCNVCGKDFNYAISLTYHLRLHSGKKYVCNICGLKYRMGNTLQRHLRTHTKDKPYQCDYCCKRFASRGEKTSHEMIHTGVRPYHCEYCGKSFIKSVNLKTHYLSHPGPHQCSFCDKTFLEMKFLKIHSKRVHREYEVADVLED